LKTARAFVRSMSGLEQGARRSFRFLLPASCFLLATFFSFSSLCSAEIFKDASEAQLSNGLKIIMFEKHNSPLVSFQVWYRAGARNEITGKTGLAHMVEHMMFKGTEKVSGEEFIRAIYEAGGEQNASTSHDFAGYFEPLSSNNIRIPIDFESDRMSHLVLRESDFRTERMVVLEERRMRVDDNPQNFLIEQLEAGHCDALPTGQRTCDNSPNRVSNQPLAGNAVWRFGINRDSSDITLFPDA